MRRRIELTLSGMEAALASTLPVRAPWPERRASVAVALREASEGPEVLLMRRAHRPGDPWSGHVSLPGGRREGRETPEETAIREAREEVGLELSGARIIGALSNRYSKAPRRLSPLAITPIVFVLGREAFQPTLSDEATRAFWLPLQPVAEGRLDAIYPWKVGPLTLRLPSWRHDGEVVWGLTHRILTELLERTA